MSAPLDFDWEMAMTGEALRSHMEILASEEMEGRETGTAGFAKAAEYVTERFREMGLEGRGDCGDYEQRIRFLRSRLAPGSTRCLLRRGSRVEELVPGEQFVGAAGFAAPEEEVTAPLAFVGYGISAPESGHEDYAGVAVKGKIAVVLSGAPVQFETDQRAFYSSPDGKQRLAARHGAIGLITVRTPADLRRLPWSVSVVGAGAAALRWLDEADRPFGTEARLGPMVALAEAGSRTLFTLAGHDFGDLIARREAGETGGFDLGVSATLARRSEQDTVSCANLVGLLRGSDPALWDEYVVCSAHLDHLGVAVRKAEREVFCGAYDNAAGVGTLLCMAATLSRGARRPRRSVLFVAFTAEEKGLQGSSYFVRNLPVPVGGVVANLNMDMPYLGFPIADVEAIGAHHSTLHDAVAEAAADVGLELSPDRMPEQVRFIRSDQFSFVKEGIPGLNLKPGAKSSDPACDGEALLAHYLQHHYHHASDTLNLEFSALGAERYVRVATTLASHVANRSERPAWKEGDFFGRTFGR